MRVDDLGQFDQLTFTGDHSRDDLNEGDQNALHETATFESKFTVQSALYSELSYSIIVY
jgi:hypothetical protein